MKILVDEGAAEDFEELLVGHEAIHVHSLGWKGLQNGDLLRAAEEHGFQVLLTVDKQMRHQQNFAKRHLALVVLDVHPTSVPNQLARLDVVLKCLEMIGPGSVRVIPQQT